MSGVEISIGLGSVTGKRFEYSHCLGGFAISSNGSDALTGPRKRRVAPLRIIFEVSFEPLERALESWS